MLASDWIFWRCSCMERAGCLVPLSWITVVWSMRAGKGAFIILGAHRNRSLSRPVCHWGLVVSWMVSPAYSFFTFHLQMKELHCLIPPVFLTWSVMASLPEASVPGMERQQVPYTRSQQGWCPRLIGLFLCRIFPHGMPGNDFVSLILNNRSAGVLLITSD